MLATEEPAREVAQTRREADVVVGIRPAADSGEGLRTAVRVAHELGATRPDQRATVLVLSEGEGEQAFAPVAGEESLVAWRKSGQGPLEATLRGAQAFSARAAVMVSGAPGAAGPHPGGATRLLDAVVAAGADLAMPVYAVQRFEGVVTTGLASPLLGALFGRRLRQPLAEEMALSRRLVDHLLGEAWAADPAHAGERSWAVTAALAGGFELAEVHLGQRPPPTDVGGDLAAALAGVVGPLFHRMRWLAPAWQRVRGSRPVPVHGEATPLLAEEGQPQVAPLIEAFQLGHRELGRLWGQVLPPQSAVALKRLASAPEDAFTLDDGLWARIVFDFAVGYHLATMDRAVLLRSMTPLYLAWVATFVREARDLDRDGVEARVGRVARAFEHAKPYLIQRWRWPDRFNP